MTVEDIGSRRGGRRSRVAKAVCLVIKPKNLKRKKRFCPLAESKYVGLVRLLAVGATRHFAFTVHEVSRGISADLHRYLNKLIR